MNIINDNCPCGIVEFTYCLQIIEILSINRQMLSIFGIPSSLSDEQAAERFDEAFRRLKDYDKLASSIGSKIAHFESFPMSTSFKDGDKEIILQATMSVIAREGKKYTLSAAIMDISSSAKKIRKTNEKLNVIANISADKIFEYDIEDDVFKISCNDGSEFVLKEVYEDFENEFKEKKLVHEEDFGAFERLCDSMRLGNEKITAQIRMYNKEIDDYHWCVIDAKTLFDSQGFAKRCVGRIQDISKTKEAEMRLINKAERDPLTKIYNKATTKQLISDYLRTDNRETLDAMIIVDVDNFKSVNDNLGHLFGDSILVDLSQELQDLFRSCDVVGRIGGDEFLVFLRGIKHRNHIEDKAADICRVFELLYSNDNGDKITGSLGISLFPQDGDTFEELFKKADIALYSSKTEGKNCYTFYSEETPELSEEDQELHVKRYSRDTILSASNSVFDNEITDFAFDIMNKTKDVSSAINMLLSKVGKHFCLSRVSVLEALDDENIYKYTYQWCSKSTQSQLGNIVTFTDEQEAAIRNGYDDNDILRYNDTVNAEENGIYSALIPIISNLQVKSLLQCAIYDSGEYKGCVTFHDCEKVRSWTIDEVKALKTICKIISSYLLKMRAFQKANYIVDKLTNFDKLTSLPHYNKFKQMVSNEVEKLDGAEKLALVYCDINNFKYINEKYGSEKGDDILISFAKEIENLNLTVKCSSRVFSDKYMMLVSYSNAQELKLIIKSFLEEFAVREKAKTMGLSIAIACGIYLIDKKDDFDLTSALDNVNIARKGAKETAAKTTVVIYDESMKQQINHAIEIVNDAKKALVNHEFVVYYQPKIGLKSSKLVGAEALVRWKRPDGSLVPPSDFIPHLEKSETIINVDFYVYEEVCKFIREHLDKNLPIVPISVNVSRVHLKTDEFLDRIKELIEKYGIPTRLLEFELTESVFLENQDAAIKTMEEMKKLGFMVSIDDFGSGFSSLNLLKSLPVDILKIDKEFFANATLLKNDEIIISSIISMANKMNISVICEGVETKEQINFLKNSECDMVQGYYYAKPINAEEFTEYSNDLDKIR